jgi:NADPH:quinone reductase
MTKAIRIHANGGPEVMKWEQVPTPQPGPNEALVRHEAVGLNYIDVYFRTGLYKAPLPATIGMEGAGVVLEVGEAVKGLKAGDRVAYAGGPIGAYATERVIPADRLVKLPDSIDFKTGAAMMLQGMTAQYLLRRTFPVQKGQTILVHAAAGGVGLILCQWAAHLGATVIGTVGSAEKAALARAHGCAHAIVPGEQDFAAAVRRLTDGKGVPVVYDSVGQDTFEGSLRCLAPCGLLVSFGTASGPIPPLDLFRLNTLGSLYVTSPAFVTHTSDRAELLARADQLFAAIDSGVLRVAISRRYPLAEAATAQEDLRARRTTGTSILLP